jgi:hypothetical protein
MAMMGFSSTFFADSDEILSSDRDFPDLYKPRVLAW